MSKYQPWKLTSKALKIRLPRCSYLQPGNPTIIGRTGIPAGSISVIKRNSLVMVALSSLLERQYTLTKLRRDPWVLSTLLKEWAVNSENKLLTASKNLQQLSFWILQFWGRTLCTLLWLRVITEYCKFWPGTSFSAWWLTPLLVPSTLFLVDWSKCSHEIFYFNTSPVVGGWLGRRKLISMQTGEIGLVVRLNWIISKSYFARGHFLGKLFFKI